MATFRQVHTKIWKDAWFGELTPKQKLLFVYLFTNEQASLAGIYELPLRFIVFETGLTKKEVSEYMAFFAKANKAYYQDEIVWVPNLPRYHPTNSKTQRIRIARDVSLLKDCLLKAEYRKLYGMDRVSEDEDGVSTPPCIISSNVMPSLDLEEHENGEEPPLEEDYPAYATVLRVWKKCFPKKAQPRADNRPLQNKLATRRKEKHFQENWIGALDRAAKSEFLRDSSWFNLGWFLKNPENWEKCLDGNYDGKAGTHQKAGQYIEEQKEHVEGDSFRM